MMTGSRPHVSNERMDSRTELLQTYAQRIRDLRRANPEVPENALAPAFQELLVGLLELLPLPPRLTVVPEFRNPDVGRPDIALVRPGTPARAFVELKAPTKRADPSRWRDHDGVSSSDFGNCRAGRPPTSPRSGFSTATRRLPRPKFSRSKPFGPTAMTVVQIVRSPSTILRR